MNDIFLNPSDFLPQDIVDKNNMLITKHNTSIFAPGPDGSCGKNSDVTVYCTKDVCIFWEYNEYRIPDHRNVLKFLLKLQEYIELCKWVMDYDPMTQDPIKTYTGSDDITRRFIIELNDELCVGYEGVSYKGRSWIACSKYSYWFSDSTINSIKPTIHNVFFNEIGKTVFDSSLDDILEWEMQNSYEWGYWSLGFNGAMSVLSSEKMNIELEYYGQNTHRFRTERLRDLTTYINNSSYTFKNTWCSYLLPWNQY